MHIDCNFHTMVERKNIKCFTEMFLFLVELKQILFVFSSVGIILYIE